MIDLENFNSQEFGDIIESARRQISHLSDEWTNTQVSDPGMTLIDLLTWIKLEQQKYMSGVSNSSQYKLLELLGIERKQNKGSDTLIKISNSGKDMIIPRGTKWHANDMIFENDFVEPVISSDIVCVDFENQVAKFRVPSESFDGERIFPLFGEELDDGVKMFRINFNIPISNVTEFGLYFDVFLDSKYKRNPITESDDLFIEFADIEWEFYGTKGSDLGWHKLDVIKDETHNFLFSGTIKFKLNGEMKQKNGVFPIRAKLVSQCYDFPPKITNIFTNVFKVSQKSTLCENNLLTKKDISESGRMVIRSHLTLYGNNIVYVKGNEGWKLTKDYTFERDINKGETRFDLGESTFLSLNNKAPDEEAVMIVAYDKSVENMMVLGSGTGISAQEYRIGKENILYDDFEIMVGWGKNKELNFDKWNKVNDFYSSGKYDKDYILDCRNSKIMFGDNEFGDAPDKAENSVILIGFATTVGKNSNIKSGIINRVDSMNQYIKNFKIDQIVNASGGVNAETFEDMKARAAKVLDSGKKAVTIKDYEDLAYRVPGLIQCGIKVLPSCLPNGEEIKEQNYVTIVVRGTGQRDMCLEGYKRNIRRYINRYRLLNTKVDVVDPVYIGLNISGQIIVNSYYRKSSDIISDSIRDFINKVNEDCGSVFYYGDLFGIIDRLECVSYIDKLHIDPIGEYKKKTLSDDIIIPPNGVYYIEKIDLSYISNANID